jgi:hypothetical protein
MFASAYFRFGLNMARAARARHAVRTTRHQERDGWAAASASRLSRRRSFFFVPTDPETTTTRWPGGSCASPSARAGPRCRGCRSSCTRLAVQSDLFDAPINAAYRPDGQPSRPSRCPCPNPTPAFGSAPARRLLSFPIPKLAVTNFRGFAHRPLPARIPMRIRRSPSRPRRAGRPRRAAGPSS